MNIFCGCCVNKDDHDSGYEDFRSTAIASVACIEEEENTAVKTTNSDSISGNKIRAISSQIIDRDESYSENYDGNPKPFYLNNDRRDKVVVIRIENQGQENVPDHKINQDDPGEDVEEPSVVEERQQQSLNYPMQNQFRTFEEYAKDPMETNVASKNDTSFDSSCSTGTKTTSAQYARNLRRNRIIADQCKLTTPPRKGMTFPDIMSSYNPTNMNNSTEKLRTNIERRIEVSDETLLAWKLNSDNHSHMSSNNGRIDPEESDMVESTSDDDDDDDDEYFDSIDHNMTTSSQEAVHNNDKDYGLESRHLPHVVIETIDSAPDDDEVDEYQNEIKKVVSSSAMNDPFWYRTNNVENSSQNQDNDGNSSKAVLAEADTIDGNDNYRSTDEDDDDKSFMTGYTSRPGTDVGESKPEDLILNTKSSELTVSTKASSEKGECAAQSINMKMNYSDNNSDKQSSYVSDKNGISTDSTNSRSRRGSRSRIISSTDTNSGAAELDAIVAAIKTSTTANESQRLQMPIAQEKEQFTGLINHRKSDSLSNPYVIAPTKKEIPLNHTEASTTKCPELLPPSRRDTSPLTTPPRKHAFTKTKKSPQLKCHNIDTVSYSSSILNTSTDTAITSISMTSNNSVSPITVNSHNSQYDGEWRLHSSTPTTPISNLNMDQSELSAPYPLLDGRSHQNMNYINVLASKDNTTEDEEDEEQQHARETPNVYTYVDDDDDEALSDIPSDVEPAIKERYLRACRKLKSSIIERKQGNIVKSFEQQLLHDFARDKKIKAQGIPSTDERQSHHVTSQNDTLASNFDQQKLLSSNILREVNDLWQKRFPFPKTSIPNPEAKSSHASRSSSPVISRISDCTPHIHNMKDIKFEERKMDPMTSTPSSDNILTNETLSFHSREQPTVSLSFTEDEFDEDVVRPFLVMGVDNLDQPTVLTSTVMEALRGFLPYSISEENFLLKYALQRDGNTLHSLLSKVKGCRHTIIVVETKEGDVFGSFCSSCWQIQPNWYGSGESFLWRLKNRRPDPPDSSSDGSNNIRQNMMEIYPYTGHDEMIQYCTKKTIAVGGGGSWDSSATMNGQQTQQAKETNTGIALMIDGDVMGGETNNCATFANPRLTLKNKSSLAFSSASSSSSESRSIDNEFEIHALEVWTLTPCLSIDAAREMEEHRIFVEQHSI